MAALSLALLGPQLSARLPDAPTSRPNAQCVLVVEDAPMLRRVIAQMLSRQGGYTVREAGTYREAGALLVAVDAVATDGYYHHHEGEAAGPWGLVLARLARMHGKRVVLLSGDSSLIERAQWEGIQALRKPDGILGLVEAFAQAGVSQFLETATC
jgi:CheY-like chemotaxis protein